MRSLKDLKPGEKAVVAELHMEGGMRRRLQDIGLIKGTAVECLGDPSAYLIRGAVIAIREEDSASIFIC